MRKMQLAVLAGGVLAACSVAVPSASAAPASFGGGWSATDTDGSNLSLAIRGAGAQYAVTERDDSAGVCGGSPALVAGAGRVDEGTLYVPVTVVCLPGGNVIRQRVTITFTYNAGADTLTDNAGVVWSRTP